MIKKRVSIICLIVVILMFSFIGCENKEFVKDYREYNKLYLDVINEVIPDDSDAIIEKLNDEHVVEKLDKMNKLVEKMSSSASTKSDKQMLSNVLLFNKGFEFLNYVASNKDNLTKDEKIKFSGEVLKAKMHRKYIQDGDF